MEKLLSFIWPIKKEELGKFLPLAFMLFFTILTYKILKSTKDSLIVPAIGAEAVSFVKFYLVVPSAVLFTMLYAWVLRTQRKQVVFTEKHQVPVVTA